MKRKRDAYAALFQTQLLKVVLTTLYVDIKEPAALRPFRPTKKPNLISGDNSRCRSSCRDKIEFQFAVPNYARTTPTGVGARFRRVKKIILQDRTSNRNNTIFFQFFNKVAPGIEGMLITASATLRRSPLQAHGRANRSKARQDRHSH